MLNQCTLIGRVCSAVEEKNVGQKTVLNFRMETWETTDGKEYKNYHTINIWSEWAKKSGRGFVEGQVVMVIGKYGTKKSEKNGVATYYSSLTAHTATTVSMKGTSPPSRDESNGNSYATPPSGSGRGPESTGSPSPSGYSGNSVDDDIPF